MRTPHEIVADVVASAALDGRRINPVWQQVLLRIATGELDADDAVKAVIADLQAVIADLKIG